MFTVLCPFINREPPQTRVSSHFSSTKVLQLHFGQSIIDCIWARLHVRLVTFLIKMSWGYKCNMCKEVLCVRGIRCSRTAANAQLCAELSYLTIIELLTYKHKASLWKWWLDQLKVWKPENWVQCLTSECLALEWKPNILYIKA